MIDQIAIVLMHPIVAVPLILAICYFGAKSILANNKNVTEHHRAAARIAGILRAKGLAILPAILEDYSVGDVVGVAAQMEKASIVLTSDESAVEKEFEKVFQSVLAARLADPAKRAALVAQVNAVEKTA